MPISYDPKTHCFITPSGGLDPGWLARCREAYPHVKLDQAMKQAALWLDADWPKRKKVKWERFLLNWFARQEHDWLMKDQNTQGQPKEAPHPKRPPLEELVPAKEIREFVKVLAGMKAMPGPKKTRDR